MQNEEIGSIINVNFDLSNFTWMFFLEVLLMVGFKVLFYKLVDKYQRKIHRKKYEDSYITGGNIFNFSTFGKKNEKKNQRVRKYFSPRQLKD